MERDLTRDKASSNSSEAPSFAKRGLGELELAERPNNAQGPWLLGKATDLALFGGSAAAALLLLALGAVTGLVHGDTPPWLFLGAVVFVDVAHVWATGYRVYLDAADFNRRAALYLMIPAIAYSIGVLAYSQSPLLFWRALAYVAVFHFVRQQYGWVALYRHKNREGTWRLLDSAAIYGATVAPLIHWHANTPRHFHWFLAGDFVPGLPSAFGNLAMAAFGAILLAYGIKELSRHRQGLPISWGKNLVVLTTAATWTLGIVVFDSDYAFTVTNVLVHGVPYFGLVYVASRRRAVERATRGDATPTLSDRLSRNAVLFMLPLLLVAWFEEWGWDRFVWHENRGLFPGPAFSLEPLALSLLVPLLALPQATHYLLDAWIWRVREENREALGAVGITAASAL